MKRLTTLIFISLSVLSLASAQSVATEPNATETLQKSQSAAPVLQFKKTDASSQPETVAVAEEPAALRIPAGTPIEVETAYTVSSIDIKRGEVLSFRVLIPVMIDGVTVIEKGAVVTARVIQAKRGGHWGKAGKLSWSMEDVVAADNTRIPLAPETHIRTDAMYNTDAKLRNNENKLGHGSVTGISHGGEVVTKTIVTAAIMPLIAPIALMHGFKRGENAILPEGKRFVVFVKSDTRVKTGSASPSK
ncbi:MAG: hypothetical protein ABR501_05180 [Pyrinomonadaceae bacterium]